MHSFFHATLDLGSATWFSQILFPAPSSKQPDHPSPGRQALRDKTHHLPSRVTADLIDVPCAHRHCALPYGGPSPLRVAAVPLPRLGAAAMGGSRTIRHKDLSTTTDKLLCQEGKSTPPLLPGSVHLHEALMGGFRAVGPFAVTQLPGPDLTRVFP
jgi:hypothetical protein